MNLFDPSLQKLFLKPGELVTTDEPSLVTTVLGSCISVTMFHRQTSTSAVCHAMLPYGKGNRSFKYVDVVIPYMTRYFERKNIKLNSLEVKLFGGADMFQSANQNSAGNKTVGKVNISVAKEYLKKYGLTLIASDVEGQKSRKLLFTTTDGVVYIEKKAKKDYYTIETS